MRSLARFLLIGLAGIDACRTGLRPAPDDQILPKSIDLMHQGQALLSGRQVRAMPRTPLETALAVDPRNRWAFIDLARVAEKQHLFGKAIRMTNKALLLEPNDLDAIAVQGEAMVELGAPPAPRKISRSSRRFAAPGMPAGRAAVCRDHARADRRLGESAGQPQEQLRQAFRQRDPFRDAEGFRAALDIDPEPCRLDRAWHGFKLDRSILRRCPKAASVSRSITADRRRAAARPGTIWTTAEVTLGGGTKAERPRLSRSAAATAIAPRPRAARMRRFRAPRRSVGDFLLEHQVSDCHHGGQPRHRAT